MNSKAEFTPDASRAASQTRHSHIQQTSSTGRGDLVSSVFFEDC